MIRILRAFFLLSMFVVLLRVRMATAAVITPVGALATSEFGAVDVFNTNEFSDVFVTDLIDGVGLIDVNNTPDNVLDDVHDHDFSSTNGWHTGDFPAGLPGGVDGDNDPFTAPDVNKQIVEFDLGGTFQLTHAHLWQQNQGIFFFPPAPAETRGVDEFELLTSTAASGDSFDLVGKFHLAAETGLENVPAQIIDLPNSPITARRVRLHILSAVSGNPNEFVGLSEVRFEGTSVSVPGDFNDDGSLTVDDINLLSAAVREQRTDAKYDVDGNGQVNDADRDHWVESLKHTWYGDSDFDGKFDAGDFIQVFVAGLYEDGVPKNAAWETGDWNGDEEFDSADFVTAFVGGGFELGPRAAIAAVPEPSAACLIVVASLALARRRGR